MFNVALKLACCLAIIVCCGIIGVEYSKKFTKKEILIAQFITFITRIEQAVLYAYTPITKIISDMRDSKGLPPELCQILYTELTVKNNSDFNRCWSSTIYNWLNVYGNDYMLDDEDGEVLKLLLLDAFNTDAEGQKQMFSLAKARLADRAKAAGEKRKKNQRLYRSIGFLIGLIISVFIY